MKQNKTQAINFVSMKKLILSFIAIINFVFIGNTTVCPSAEVIPGAPALPYTQSLICGSTNDITSANSAAGTGGNYLGGQESVYTWTPTSSYSGVTIAYTGQTWSGIFLYSGCPTSGGALVGFVTSSASSKTLTVTGNINSGTTYYIVFDTWPTPNSPCAGSFTLNGTELPYCAGIPSPGNTLSTVTSVCPTIPFTLSLENSPALSGFSFQWQISTDGVSYTDIAGANSSTYLANQSASNFYQCIVTCISDGTPVVSTPVQVGINGFISCYCTPAPTSTDGSGITNVVYGTVSNPTAGEPGGYFDYSNLSSDFSQNDVVNLDLTYATGYTYNTKIWVDWNNNGSFLDAGEEMYTGVSTNANPTTLNTSFTIPANATAGTHRMRIGGCDIATPIPCYTGSWGTYEDYSLNILPSCSPISIVNPGSQSVCSSYSLPAIAEVTPSGNADLIMNYYDGPNGTGNIVSGPITSTQTIYAFGTAALGACTDDEVFTITVNFPNSGIDVQHACGPYTWINGVTYTSSNNTATHTLTNAAGCDSTVTLNLTMGAPNTGVDVQHACGPYTWIDGVTYSANNNTASHTLTNVSGCDSIVTLNLTVASASISANGNTTFCQNQSVVLTSSASTGNLWSNSANSPSITVSTSGNYSVTITDAFGCVTTSNSINVVVNSIPVVSGGADQTFCSGMPITLSGSGAQNYSWNNGISDGQAFTPASTLNCIVTGTDANGCSNTDTVLITVNQPTYFTIIGSAINSFSLNGQTYDQTGVYTQTIPNAAGCDSIITLDLYMDYLGLSENEQVSFSVYPNPTNDVLNIQFIGDIPNSNFIIVDLQGRVVLEGTLFTPNSIIDLNDIDAGSYYLKLGVSNKKIQFLKL